MAQKNIYIITGGPGFGKTELIDELHRAGYLCSGEFARELIEHQQEIDGDLLPWKNPKLFQKKYCGCDKIFSNRFLMSVLHLPTAEYLINWLLRDTRDLQSRRY